MEGYKDDGSKIPLDLLPPDALWQVGKVLQHGAARYSPRNWESGMRWGRMLAACLRHLFAWMSGEDNDRESGFPHLAHATCCCLFLLSHQLRAIGIDDRNKLAWKPEIPSDATDPKVVSRAV